MSVDVVEKPLVVVESPFKGAGWEETRRNVLYAKCAIKDCLERGEAPYASHLNFTQAGILDDTILEERYAGIMAGVRIVENFDISAFYVDFGMSAGMTKFGLTGAEKAGREIQYRKVNDLQRKLKEMGEAVPPIDLGGLLF
jgi:hypothetical protein